MSTFDLNFKAKLVIGGILVPIASDLVINTSAGAGVSTGFLFKLDRQPSDPPVSIYLGDVINFIETKLGSSDLSQSPDMALIANAFSSANQPGQAGITVANFNATNQTVINVYEFSINSASNQFLFSFNLDIEGSNPAVGLIPLPSELAGWLKIENISIAFSATTQNT